MKRTIHVTKAIRAHHPNGRERRVSEQPEGEYVILYDPSGTYRTGARFNRYDITGALDVNRSAFGGVVFLYRGREWRFSDELPKRPRKVYKKTEV